MLHQTKRGTLLTIVSLYLFLAFFTPFKSSLAAEENYIAGGLGVSGYDPVSYFVDGAPIIGNDAFAAEYDGVVYRFATASNRERFLRNPSSYVPAYGGFCAFGTAMGRKFSGDPTAWKIVDGTLYLNLNKDVQKTWLEDVPEFIKGADHNWPLIRPIADVSLEASPPNNITLGAL